MNMQPVTYAKLKERKRRIDKRLDIGHSDKSKTDSPTTARIYVMVASMKHYCGVMYMCCKAPRQFTPRYTTQSQ